MEPIVIVITTPELLILSLVLAALHIVRLWQALRRASRALPARHGLRKL